MPYELGVDLGTTFTAAAVRNGGEPTMVGLGNRALQVPSVLLRTDDGFVVGEAAERRGTTEPRRLVREFKRRLGDPVPVLIDGAPYSAEMLSATLLRWVVDVVTRRQGEPPAGLVLTHPASWSEYKLDVLRQVVTLAEVGPARWSSEPVAAAAQYASRARVAVGERLGVYDLGGGTFDACVLEKTEVGFVALGPAEGVEHLGGVDFDEAVFEQVRSLLVDRLADVDPDDPDVTAALARLRRECVEAKEALSADAETTIPVALPGLLTSVRLTRAELEQLIAPAVEQTMAATSRAIRGAGLAPHDLSGIVLVGGSSRIPLVGEVLQRTFGVPAALDTHPKHDVALGALRTSPTTRPAAPARAGASLPPAPSAPEVDAGVPAPPPARGSRRRRGATPAPVWDSAPARVTATSADPVAPAPAPPHPPAAPAPAPAPAPPAPTALPAPPVPAAPLARTTPTRPTAPAIPATPTRGLASSPTTAEPAVPAGPAAGRRRVLVVAAALVLVLALAFVVVPRLVRGSAPAAEGPALSQAPPATSPVSTPTASPSPRAVVPQAAPLPDDELVVPMEEAGNWDLYLASTTRPAPLQRLTRSSATDTLPALSPDRRTVAYQRFAADHPEQRSLRVVAVDGTGDRPFFTEVPAACARSISRPAWSPTDPDLLVLVCTDAKGRTALYRAQADGTVLGRLPQPDDLVGDVTFSPDATRLAFWSAPRSDWDGGDLYVMSADGTGPPTRLTRSTVPGEYADPVFSPDGTQVVYRKRDANGTARGDFNLYRTRADGTGSPTALVKRKGSDEQDPGYAPDGQEIAFKSDAPTKEVGGGRKPRVWVMGSDGSDPHVLLTEDADGEQTAAAWTHR